MSLAAIAQPRRNSGHEVWLAATNDSRWQGWQTIGGSTMSRACLSKSARVWDRSSRGTLHIGSWNNLVLPSYASQDFRACGDTTQLIALASVSGQPLLSA